jgi:hypothetical protein
MQIEGETCKPFRIFEANSDGYPVRCVWEGNSASDEPVFKPRMDKLYRYEIRRTRVSRDEFWDQAGAA